MSAGVALLAIAGVVSAANPEPINCVGTSYDRTLVTIPVGGTVEWTCDFNAHPLVSDEGLWPEYTGTADFSHIYQSNGTFLFHCRIHGSSGMKGKVVVGTGVPDAPVGSLPGKPSVDKASPRYRTIRSLLRAKRFRICVEASEPVKRTVTATAVGKGGRTLFRVKLADRELIDTGQDCLMSKRLSKRILRKLRRFRGKQVAYGLTVTVTDSDGETTNLIVDPVVPKR